MFKRKTTYIENWFFMEQQCNVKFWRRKHSRKRNSIVTKDLHAQNKRLIVSIQYRDDAHCFFFDFIRVVYFECFALRSYGQMWALFCNGCAKKFAKRYQSTHGSFTDPYQFFSFVPSSHLTPLTQLPAIFSYSRSWNQLWKDTVLAPLMT